MAAAQPGTSSSAQASDNRIFLFRLQMLIIDGGLAVLRNYVDQELSAQSITLSGCLANEKTTIKLLKGRGIITQVQYDLLYPTSGTVSTLELDITLIICLMRNLKCFKLNKKFNWNISPGQSDTSIEADICRLKNYRNEICHISTTTGIQYNNFSTKWKEIEQILLRIDKVYPIKDFKQTITDFEYSPLDPKTEQRVTDEIEKWEKHDKAVEAVIEFLKAGHNKTTEDLNTVKTKIDEIEERLPAPHKSSNMQDERRQENRRKGNLFLRFFERRRYRHKKKKLQGDLIKFYRNNCGSIPLSPLLEEVDTPLAGFYVMPDIVAIQQKSPSSDKEVKTPVKSLSDLFSVGRGNQQEIYLSADAGFGKTAFSKYLAITWCQAHHKDKNYRCFKYEELKALSDFEFLFLVLLRDCSDICSIDKMIEQQIIEQLPTSVSIERILRKETCLIILDGLDEWTHPENGCSRRNEKIPHRYMRDKCVILTTSRPWKLGVSNLKTSQLNKKIELVQLSEDSTLQLEKNALSKMTGVPDGDELMSKTRDLNKVIDDCGLQHMQTIPLLLMFITCLWCNGIPIGNSKLDVYTKIIEFLLSRTAKKYPEIQPSCDSSASDIPEYFRNHNFIKTFYSLIKSLSELAYQTLFNETKENTLVFDGSVAKTYLKADDMKISLFSGILSESRTKTLIKEITKVSFSHKTVQEYFAAIFISYHSDAQKIIMEKCRNVQDILDMSIVWKLIIEMNADLMYAISNDLMSVINEDAITREQRTWTGYKYMYQTPLYNIQKMFMSCIQEMPESENIQLSLQDFFIDWRTKHSEQLQRLSKQNKTNIKSLYIDIRDTFRSLCEIIDVFSLTDLSHIQKLYYDGDGKEEAMISRILFPSLQSVTLSSGKWPNDDENLGENLARLQNLQYLYIEWFMLSHKILETFSNFISGQKSMKELTLRRFSCKEHGYRLYDCKRWNLDLSQHLTLSKLNLYKLFGRLQLNISTPSLVNVTLNYINLDESSVLLSCDMLNIERVELQDISMSEGSLQNFITVLDNLPQSVTVKMADIEPETEYKRIKENIRRSQTFHVIQDHGDYWRGAFEFKTRKPSKE
ncbi:uncharacterized protein LOC132744789 [Ruditapes philippinarum]|uniref:uncharacterized protein LOC132744789 n=1 Tax=Ruditapes philippinarum TaxID=129788 RepID=UPI00295B7E20|nr:uncharacterized protein LOC132744789 [Ruditapes philippinarum]